MNNRTLSQTAKRQAQTTKTPAQTKGAIIHAFAVVFFFSLSLAKNQPSGGSAFRQIRETRDGL